MATGSSAATVSTLRGDSGLDSGTDVVGHLRDRRGSGRLAQESPDGARRLHKNVADTLMISANGSLTGYALDPNRFSQMHPEEWADFGGRSLSAIRDLLNRSMLVWICALALLVIFGIA